MGRCALDSRRISIESLSNLSELPVPCLNELCPNDLIFDDRLAAILRILAVANPTISAQVHPMIDKYWIVVGTDFSDGARCALMRALSLAERSGTNVVLVHAYEELVGGKEQADPTPALLTLLTEEIAASGAAKRGIHVEPLVRRGAPWDKILNVATEYGAEFVAVGATGQRGIEAGFPLGGVTSRVLARSSRSVLVARPGT